MSFDKNERTILLCAGILILGMCVLIPLKDQPDITTGLTGGFLGTGFLIFVIAFYFLPSIIGRKKRNAAAIFFLNFTLGWTLVGWIIAMTWALTRDPAPIQTKAS
jgi:predicted membrane protein